MRSDLTIVINGGLGDMASAHAQLDRVDGVMLGRAAYQTPYILADVDSRLFGSEDRPVARDEALERMLPYVEAHLARGGRLNNITRHILGLYHGQPGAKAFRRYLSENAIGDAAGIEVLRQAIAVMRERANRTPVAAEWVAC